MYLAVHDQPKAKNMLKEHPELLEAPEGSGRGGETALHYLAIENYGDAVRFLCELGFDVNATDGFESVLSSVVSLGHVDMSRILLELGADVNACDHLGDAMLDAPASRGRVELVDLLLEHGADGNYENELGENIFDAILGHPPSVKEEMLKVLDKHGVERRRPRYDREVD